ncbi:hypothetical protein [Variovorax saccharolyticus]|uniref:hypothetical protein n=1 Tax=Variovorax saccharolyticus TaxID=3053516 RepID=UPI002575F18B|nr:hypothetical protein [Variovorax sp. J22R187]MDM0018847.1 hypothetical protein [Variovorax sp. J22R187]
MLARRLLHYLLSAAILFSSLVVQPAHQAHHLRDAGTAFGQMAGEADSLREGVGATDEGEAQACAGCLALASQTAVLAQVLATAGSVRLPACLCAAPERSWVCTADWWRFASRDPPENRA